MISLRVLDADFEVTCKTQYDIAIFASGYEARCIHTPGLINPRMVTNPFVFGFTEEPHAGNRHKNDAFYLKRWNCKPIPLSGDDEKPIYEHLHGIMRALDRPLHIILDYSSMSRLWYTAVLNWARFAARGREVIIDFVYAMGSYEEETPPMVIRGMVPLPGCEGRAYRLRESVAVFGLGFYGSATLCVLDRLEADTVYAFLASPGSSEEYVAKTQEINKELIGNPKTKDVLELPMASIESCYRHLAETIAPHRPDGEITLVPMGPKPHVLASILLAMRFPEVACLRVSGAPAVDVKPTGDIVATRVIVRGD
ncbi:MAG: hypothetical protein A2X59_11720 [Nitrospirae bacterium GWC2_42_7]|nr:MAG: hypothetical protein A2X59_11720 [Nitrospirae bacterium GWC2_42_7]